MTWTTRRSGCVGSSRPPASRRSVTCGRTTCPGAWGSVASRPPPAIPCRSGCSASCGELVEHLLPALVTAVVRRGFVDDRRVHPVTARLGQRDDLGGIPELDLVLGELVLVVDHDVAL